MLFHLVIVGTSVLRNFSLRVKNSSSQVREIAVLCGRARPGSDEDRECAKRVTPGSPVFSSIYGELVNDPYGMSAELNAMRPWLEAFLRREDKSFVAGVLLLHSDTGAGWVAAKLLEEFFRDARVDVAVARVPDLGSPRSIPRGLVNLCRMVSREVDRVRRGGYCPVINLTGGFKPESGYALLCGLERAFAAYYIHESFRRPIVLPLKWSLKAIEYVRERRGLVDPNLSHDLECLRGFFMPVELVDLVYGRLRITSELYDIALSVMGRS